MASQTTAGRRQCLTVLERTHSVALVVQMKGPDPHHSGLGPMKPTLDLPCACKCRVYLDVWSRHPRCTALPLRHCPPHFSCLTLPSSRGCAPRLWLVAHCQQLPVDSVVLVALRSSIHCLRVETPVHSYRAHNLRVSIEVCPCQRSNRF